MTNLLHPGSSTRSGFPMGVCSLCKREDIQILHTAANFGKSTASKIRRINTLARYKKKSFQRFVGNALPPISKTYASPDCPYPKKMMTDIKKTWLAPSLSEGGRSNANAIPTPCHPWRCSNLERPVRVMAVF
jgi:hypothetical protein